jgi:GNAT superfamily N-acetyltransferase
VLLAEDAGRTLGYALFYPSYDSEHAARGLYLQDLFVVPEARRRGVGRALMAAIARACEADGGCYLFWNALESNRAARTFYRRIGGREEPVVTLSLQPDALRRLAAKG